MSLDAPISCKANFFEYTTYVKEFIMFNEKRILTPCVLASFFQNPRKSETAQKATQKGPIVLGILVG